MRDSGLDDPTIYSWLDTNTTLTAGSIQKLLGTSTSGSSGSTIDDLYNNLG